jgi:transposase
VFRDMEQWTKIRLQVEHEGLSIREVQRRTGLHFKTIKKILANPEPPPFDCPERAKPKIGPFLERIAGIVAEDKSLKKKQRHTAKRIFERLQEEGYTGGYTAVKDVVRDLKRTSQEVFVALMHRPGEAQMDFGQALVKMDGVLRKVLFFAMALPYSDAMFVAAYPRENTETFQDGHVRAFEFFGGVCPRASVTITPRPVSRRSSVRIHANAPTVFCNCKVTICSTSISDRCVGPTRRGSSKGWSSLLG